MLGGSGREEIERGVGGVAGVLLQEAKGCVKRTRLNGARDERLDDGVGLFGGGNEGCGGSLDGRDEASPAKLDREKGLRAGWVIEGASDETSEGAELERVKVFVDR